MATLKAFEQKDLEKEGRYPTSAYDNLKRKIAANDPKLAKESPEPARRRFDKITEKIRRSLPFKTWQEMDSLPKAIGMVLLDSNIFIVDRLRQADKTTLLRAKTDAAWRSYSLVP